jgi:ribosome maturation factor RimP
MAGDRQADRYALANRVIDLLEGELAAEGFELIDVRVFLGGGRHQVRIYLDTEEGIDLDGCARASRTAGMLLEEADLFPHQYVVEVSSPGVRRPLRTAEHFAAAVGEDVELKLNRPGKAGRLRGRLLAVESGALRVLPAGAEADAAAAATADDATDATVRTVSLATVLEANLDPEFDAQALIGADRRRRKDEKRQRRRARRRRKSAGPAADDGENG